MTTFFHKDGDEPRSLQEVETKTTLHRSLTDKCLNTCSQISGGSFILEIGLKDKVDQFLALRCVCRLSGKGLAKENSIKVTVTFASNCRLYHIVAPTDNWSVLIFRRVCNCYTRMYFVRSNRSGRGLCVLTWPGHILSCLTVHGLAWWCWPVF